MTDAISQNALGKGTLLSSANLGLIIPFTPDLKSASSVSHGSELGTGMKTRAKEPTWTKIAVSTKARSPRSTTGNVMNMKNIFQDASAFDRNCIKDWAKKPPDYDDEVRVDDIDEEVSDSEAESVVEEE